MGCHDSPRKNPLDPALTPPVVLNVALADTTGTAVLTWTPYQGDTPFVSYQILRSVTDRINTDTLATITGIDTLTYIDTSLATNTTYAYRVAVRNSAGFVAASIPITVGPLHLPAIAQLQADFDAPTASATLTWSPYQGPRFSAYQVLRRAGDTERIVAEFDAIADTAFVDTGLHGSIDYTYQVVVRTEREERIEGAMASGSIHPFLAEWPLDTASAWNGRLYSVAGEIRAGLFEWRGKNGMRLIRYDREGQLLADQRLAPLESQIRDIAQSDDGRLWLLGIGPFLTLGLISLDPDDQVHMHRHDLFTNELAAPLVGDEATVLGEIGLGRLDDPATGAEVNAYLITGNLSVTRGGDLLYSDFTPATETLNAGWSLLNPDNFGETLTLLTVGNQSSSAFPANPLLAGRLFWNSINRTNRLQRTHETWSDFRLQADVKFDEIGSAAIEIGGDTFSRFTLGLSGTLQRAQLDWTYVAPDGAQSRTESYTQPFPVLHDATYRLSLEAVQGQVRTHIETPVFWAASVFPTIGIWRSSMVELDGDFALAADDLAYHVDSEGNGDLVGELAGRMRHLQTWEVDGVRFIGALLPAEGRIVWGPIVGSNTRNWPGFLRRSIGPFFGTGDGSLNYPIAFDVGPDGRFYVLDGVHYRVVVFDAQGNYITQWGTRGSGPGAFDFGSGNEVSGNRGPVRDFRSDIAVDDEGFVYVLDFKNERIQKFAP